MLRLEHGNLSRLLGLIEEQVTAFQAGDRMDQELLRLASEYFTGYPDRCHHPKEDLIYTRLGIRDPDSGSGLHGLGAEHRRLHLLADAFAQAVSRPQPGKANPQEVILEFTRSYREHIRLEEEQFFPLAEQRLSRDDWESLDFAMFDQDDPLFDHAAERRFAALRERIMAMAEDGHARRSVMQAAESLRELRGMEDFNDSMSSTGLRFRLARFAEGGYGLEDNGKLLLRVPESSAQRAAWCAYCYVRGLGAQPDQSVPSTDPDRT